MSDEAKSTIVGCLIVLLVVACGIILQARWDKECGKGNRWHPEEWRCVSQDYRG